MILVITTKKEKLSEADEELLEGQLGEIGQMINDGYHTGIDLPYGFNWHME